MSLRFNGMVVAGWLGYCILAASQAAIGAPESKLSLPWQENFASNKLDSQWSEIVPPNGKIIVKDNWITFESSLPQQCHIKRIADVDNITVSAKVVRWSGIYLVWNKDNWCGVGKLSPTPFGMATHGALLECNVPRLRKRRSISPTPRSIASKQQNIATTFSTPWIPVKPSSCSA
jgi:hypothetical protein